MLSSVFDLVISKSLATALFTSSNLPFIMSVNWSNLSFHGLQTPSSLHVSMFGCSMHPNALTSKERPQSLFQVDSPGVLSNTSGGYMYVCIAIMIWVI